MLGLVAAERAALVAVLRLLSAKCAAHRGAGALGRPGSSSCMRAQQSRSGIKTMSLYWKADFTMETTVEARFSLSKKEK